MADHFQLTRRPVRKPNGIHVERDHTTRVYPPGF
jgi:hypothetical protein